MMKLTGAKQQTFLLTFINGIVRAMGLAMRIVMSRMLGAEVMGIMELAQSVHMVVISPLTSGLPSAISRLCARADENCRFMPLASGLKLARMFSFAAIPMLWLLSPVIARAMGDSRVLPSLWFSSPCILILGYSAACNGYCYGTNQGWIPAVSELIEQCARLLLTITAMHFLNHLTAAWLAAVPTAATMIAEIIGLFYVMRRLSPVSAIQNADRYLKPVFRLAYPVTLSRILQTVIRSLTAILIPLQLQKSGLSAAESTARLGMLNGMVMPILMLPCIFTSALSMVMLPRIAKAEEQPSELRRLLFLSASGCAGFSALCAAAIWCLSPFLAIRLYRQAELTRLFQLCAPMTFLFSANHLLGSTLSALGLQKQSLYVSCAVSLVTLGLTYLWTAEPAMRIHGVVFSQYAGHALTLVLSILTLLANNVRQKRQIL